MLYEKSATADKEPIVYDIVRNSPLHADEGYSRRVDLHEFRLFTVWFNLFATWH